MKSEILHLLRCADDYVSGQQLCETFGVSRTAVWKVINQLKEEGYVINSVQNKGYRITEYPDIIIASEIESLLLDDDGNMQGICQHIKYFDETDSTNNQAKLAAEKDAQDGTLFVAECQTGGRGRRGRTWVSPAGSGIWMSLLLRPHISPESASMLTLVLAVAMVEAINEEVKDAKCYVKWPNDIVLNSKKISGTLTEMSAEMDAIHYVVIGIGINVNTTDFDESIKDMATSIYLETGTKVKRSSIIAAFSKSFKKYYEAFLETEDLTLLIDRYNEILINKGRTVKAIYANKELIGEALGINKDGELIIKTEDGASVAIRAGEVSVRGLYGYV